MPYRLWARMGQKNHVWDGVRIRRGKGQFLRKEEPIISIGTFCRELCENRWTGRFAVWIVDSGGPKEAQVQSYSPGGASVPTCEGTLALPGEYDWTVRLWRRCGLKSNYFDHLLLLLAHQHKAAKVKIKHLHVHYIPPQSLNYHTN